MNDKKQSFDDQLRQAVFEHFEHFLERSNKNNDSSFK